MPNQTDKIAKAVSYLRKRAGYTQKDLADRLGVSDKAVSKWERGVGMPDISYIRKLSILLDTDSDSLLSGDVIHHHQSWGGLLILNNNNISADTIIYDKPLINYILSYFLLVGIKSIRIVADENDISYMKSFLGDGSIIGSNLTYAVGTEGKILSEEDFNGFENLMIVLGKDIIYGVDQTRFFQKAMIDSNKITMLALPKGMRTKKESLCFDADRKIVSTEEDSVIKTQYNYSDLPIFFVPVKELKRVFEYGKFKPEYLLEEKDVYVEVLDRGFVDIAIENEADVRDASDLIRIIQNRCGMTVYCLEEVAWRRGMISTEQMLQLASRNGHEEYAQHLLGLAKESESPIL